MRHDKSLFHRLLPVGTGLAIFFLSWLFLYSSALAGVRAGGTAAAAISVAAVLPVPHRVADRKEKKNGDNGEDNNIQRFHGLPPFRLKGRAKLSRLASTGMDDMTLIFPP